MLSHSFLIAGVTCALLVCRTGAQQEQFIDIIPVEEEQKGANTP